MLAQASIVKYRLKLVLSPYTTNPRTIRPGRLKLGHNKPYTHGHLYFGVTTVHDHHLQRSFIIYGLEDTNR